MKKYSLSLFVFKSLQKKLTNQWILSFLIGIFLLGFYFILYKLYIPHLNSFGCFDECMNYLGGYFLLHHRQLYTQIFFNHQPLMAYISWVVLRVLHPANLFQVLLRYREFLFIFSFIANFFIIRRFRWAGVGFVIVFELSKYYLFGDKFLAESFIVYPIVYLTGLVLYKFEHAQIHPVEYILAGVITWFVFFSREPFIPITVMLLILLLGFGRTLSQEIGYGVFFILTGITLFFLPLQEYFYQVFIINSQGVGAADAKNTQLFGWGIFRVFLYPLFIFGNGQWNEFRILLVGFSAIFCLVTLYFLANKKYTLVFVAWFVLGLANLRPIIPGELFYASFHFMVYFGMFVLMTLLLVMKIKELNKKFFIIGVLLFIISLGSFILLSKNFIFLHINQQTEFVINFGQSYEVGNVVGILSQPFQTFFIDNSDNVDIAYLISGRDSSYPYADYGFVAPSYKKFVSSYTAMWGINPPDFYYGFTLPKSEIAQYQVLDKNGKASNVYIKKSVLHTIPSNAWNQIKQFGYTLPSI